jgi:hypothetical protein
MLSMREPLLNRNHEVVDFSISTTVYVRNFAVYYGAQ